MRLSLAPIRGLRLQQAAVVCIVMGVVWAAIVYQVRHAREDALVAARQHGINVSWVVAQHFAVFVGTVDQRLSHLRVQWGRDPAHFDDALAAADGMLGGSAFSRVFVADAGGRIVFSSSAIDADRAFPGLDFFKAQRDSKGDRLFVGKPVSVAADGRIGIPFSRSLRDARGRFAGVMVLWIDPDVLIGAYKTLGLGGQGFITLCYVDGTVLLRTRDVADALHRPRPDWTAVLPADQISGSFIRPATFDGVERLISFHRVAGFPLVAAAGQSLDEVLVRYYEARRDYVIGGVLVSAMLLLLLAAALRKAQRDARAEAELRASEERFRSLTQLSADLYWEQDAEYRFSSFSHQGGEWLTSGWPPGLGKRRWELGYINMTEADWAVHIARLDARQPFRDLELCRINEAGEKNWMSVSGEPMFDERGRFAGYRGVARNISQRKNDEENLRRFRAAMDMSGDMIMLIDRETMRFVDFNERFRVTLGYSREELLSMGPQDILPRSRAELERAYDELIAKGDSHVGLNSRYRCSDGSYLPFEAMRRALRSGDRWIIVAIARDTTERIAAEKALRRSNERFDLAVRATNDVIRDWDTVTDALWWNENLARVFGYAVGEIDRTGSFWRVNIHPDDFERVVDGFNRMIDSGDDQWSDEYRFRRSDGTYAHVLDRCHVVRNESGKALRVIGAMADITVRKEAEERLTYLAQFDNLTGLPNRHLFRDRLTQSMAQAARTGRPIAVLFIDLDRFKLVNDTLGHVAGDLLLTEATARLQGCIRSGDTVGRFGGDEFGAILAGLARPADASIVAQKIIDTLARPFLLDGHETYVTASIGITLFPADGDDAGVLIRNADNAMYRAKEQGRNGYQYFTREMNERAMQRVRIEAALRRAVERREFRLHYQPKVRLRDGRVCGFEALLRWQNPYHGLVPPAEFIPVLEDTGLIVAVGEWVLEEVCAQIRRWQQAGLDVPPVAVNLSARQFQHKGFEESVRRILDDADVPPSLVELELTESLLMKDPEAAERTLQGLKASNVKLSVDDFGTGYSSLSYLKRFPLDTLKVDRAFIREVTSNPDDAAITQAIIGLAHSLKLGVIAEGVETQQQLDFLRSHGCDEIQGYLFSKPVGADECARMLREGVRLEVEQGADGPARKRRARRMAVQK